MQIFGQVWLWSLGSFLLGVLFTWLLLVRPARRRLVELEDAAMRQPAIPPRQPTRIGDPLAPPTGKEADKFLDDLFETSQTPPPLAPPTLPPPPQMMPTATAQLAPQLAPMPAPQAAMAGPTAPPEPPIPDESDTELSDNPFQQFTESTTVFVPPANLRQPAEIPPTGEDWFAKEEESDPQQITDVEDDEVVDDSGTIFTQHTTPIPAETIRALDATQPPPKHELPAEDGYAEPSQAEAGYAEPGYVDTGYVEPAEVAPASSERSLFEPVVPVAQAQEDTPDDFVPPGPFGPGSAMPLPGGGAPAPEFSVKASVTALRYCTQDNPQFDRIVAEVWFRSPSDAERVGFRVLS